jgi:pimeloyl-ACP methyl ester carboxylesterase
MRSRVFSAFVLILIIAFATAGLQWNRARLVAPPDPAGDLLVTPTHTSWSDSGRVTRADVYLPAGRGPFPTLLFSPGFGTPIGSYSTFLTNIASYGFLVVAVPHPPIANPDSAKLIDVESLAAGTLQSAMNHLTRATDDSILARIDTTRIAAFGHSIGGAAAALACTDRRFKAAVDLDGSLYGRVVHEGVACPFLLVERSLSRVDTSDAPVFYEDRSQGRLHEDSLLAHSRVVQWITVDGLDHMSFTDPALTFRTTDWMKESAGLRLNAAGAQQLAADLTIDFLSHELGVEQQALLVGDKLPRGVHRTVKP